MVNRGLVTLIVSIVVVLVVGVGAYSLGSAFSGTQTSITTQTIISTSTTTVAPSSSASKFVDATVTVIADLRLGSDNQTHDTFAPSNFTMYAGQTVNLTIVNYDDMAHSFTSPSLGVNFAIPGAGSDGVPSVTHFSFTASKAGVFRYWCVTPCDDWAMAADPADGQIGMVGFMGGFVTVLASG